MTHLHWLFLKAKVKGVFAGDNHRYDRREKEGILYLISGGGGTLSSFPLKREEDIPILFGSALQKEKIEGEVVVLGGQIQERFVIE